MKEIRTKIGQLHLYDLVKGAFLAAVTGPVELILEILDKGDLPTQINWLAMAKIVVSTFFAYLIKQLITGSSGKILTNKPKNMPTFFCPVPDYNHIVVGSGGLTVDQYINANQGYFKQDGPETPTGFPNVGYIGAMPPADMQVEDPVTNARVTRSFEMANPQGMPNHRPTL